MGARQSRRSVDITTTPKKEGIPTEGGVVIEGAEKIEKLGMIEEADAKPTSNGVAPHTDSAEDKDKDKDEATEKDQDKEKQVEEPVAADKEEAKPGEPSAGEAPIAEVTAEAAPVAEVTTPTETPTTPANPDSAASTPDTKEAKKKDKSKKKWSFRSISFSRKDKSKPVRESTPKNGDVAKEEPLAEGGEEAEAAAATTTEAATPEDKSAVTSPAEETKEAPKDEKSPSQESDPAPAPAVAATPKEEPMKEEPAPVVDAAVAVAVAAAVAPAALPESKVEVSPAATSQPIATPDSAITTSSSITEKKTTEDTSLPCPSETSSGVPVVNAAPVTSTVTAFALPSSPPPTPVDPSPLQRAQQIAPSATALAEALKLPHETQQRQDHDDDLAQKAAASLQDPRLAQEVVELEESLQRSLSSQVEEPAPAPVLAEHLDDDVPPPLPVSPAPSEASRIASFAATTMQESVAVILDNAVTTTLPEEVLKPKPNNSSSVELLPPPSPPTEQSPVEVVEEKVIAEEFPLPPESEITARLNNGVHNGPEDVQLVKDEEKKVQELNLQNVPEPEPAVIVENNVSAKNEIVPIENGVADEAPKSPPPAVPVETPQPAPAITEDVTSVTKAIEEIDISEKAVAAAVNENIESAGANEIVADSIHQNNLNE